MENTIGLFGTCDGSTWRVPVIDRLTALGIKWYNPDAGDNWEPWMAEEENRQLKEDHIILFPVLGESLGFGSLGEIGFSILNIMEAIQNGSDQTLIVLIDDECTDDRKSEQERKLSRNARKLVKSKLNAIKHSNVYLVNTVDEMVDLAVGLHGAYNIKDEVNKVYRPALEAVG